MLSPVVWPESPAPTDRDIEVLQQQREDLLAQYRSHITPAPDDNGSNGPSLTIYELLQQNPDTSELVRLLDQVPSLRDELQDAQSSYTVLAPNDLAIADFDLQASELETLLKHHVLPQGMALEEILDTPNVASLVRQDKLNGFLLLRLRPVDSGIQVNGHARITKCDIRAANGVIHLVDRVISLPPTMAELLAAAPEGQFSLLKKALQSTGLLDDIASSKSSGGTFFAPTDEAFSQLNDDLLRPEHVHDLRSILSYHMVPHETLYSNVFYHGDNPNGTTSPPIGRKPKAPAAPAASSSAGTPRASAPPSAPKQSPKGRRLLKGQLEFPLPTMLGGALSHVEVARCGGMISMFVREGGASVVVQDVIAADGVVHVVDRVLVPPK